MCRLRHGIIMSKAMATTIAPMTLDAFLALPEKEGIKRELSHGVLIEEDLMGSANWPHERVKANFTRILVVFADRHDLGMVFPESMFLFQEGSRIPDVSFLKKNRVPVNGSIRFFQGAPDIAIEVVSSESAADLEDKVAEYLASGASWVWVAYPHRRTVRAHSPSGTSWILQGAQRLEAPDVLPGFSEPVSVLFEGI